MRPTNTPGVMAIEWLSDFVKHYPATAEEIRDIALESDFDDTMIKFLELFSPREKFYSRPDFVGRCLLLSNIIKEEQDSQKEFLIGSQE